MSRAALAGGRTRGRADVGLRLLPGGAGDDRSGLLHGGRLLAIRRRTHDVCLPRHSCTSSETLPGFGPNI